MTWAPGGSAAEASAVAGAWRTGVPARSHSGDGRRNGSACSGWSSGGRSTSTGIKSDGGIWGSGSRSSRSSSVGSVNLDGNLLEDVEGFFDSGVDGKDHALSAVRTGALLAVPPGWLLFGDGVLPCWGWDNGVIWVREKAGIKFGACLLDARVVEG